MQKIILTEEQIKSLRESEKKKPTAQDQVGGKVNAGIMDAVAGFCEEGAEPESDTYKIAGEINAPVGGRHYHINESPDANYFNETCDDEDAIPFLYLYEADKVFVGGKGEWHGLMLLNLSDEYDEKYLTDDDDYNPFDESEENWDGEPRGTYDDMEMTGRYWQNRNIISFWKTPVDNLNKMRRAISALVENGALRDVNHLLVDYWDSERDESDNTDKSPSMVVPYKWFLNGTFRHLFKNYKIVRSDQVDDNYFQVSTSDNKTFYVDFNGEIYTMSDIQKKKYGIDIDFTKDDDYQPAYQLNESVGEDFDLTEAMRSLMDFMSRKIEIKPFPEIHLNDDEQDGLFIKTGYYLPDKKLVTLFTAERHPKDILRSLAHELIHHNQNLRDPNIDWGSAGNLEDNKTLRKLEAEAFLKGNILFREWTEYIKPRKKETVNESIDIKKALKNLKKRRDPNNIEKWNIDEEIDNDRFLHIYAVNQFGTTDDFNSAGFILKTGELLDLGKYDEITRTSHGAFDVLGSKYRDFINGGNIRVNPESPGIELYRKPTDEQFEKISEMIRHYLDRGVFYVDCVGGDGSNIWNKEYRGEETQNIISDLKSFFDKGKKPVDMGNEVLGGHNLRDFLRESAGDFEFHYTSLRNLMKMMETDTLNLQSHTDQNREGKKYLSLTRMRSSAEGYGLGMERGESPVIRIELDGRKLNTVRSVSVHPYDYMYNNYDEIYADWDDEDKPERMTGRQSGGEGAEAEDSLTLKDGNDQIVDAIDYITRIDILLKERPSSIGLWDKFLKQMEVFDDWADKMHFFINRSDFNRQRNEVPMAKVYQIYSSQVAHSCIYENVENELCPCDVDLSSFNIKKKLNPKFWKNGHLDSRIRLKLMDIADAVMKYIDADWFDPEDVIMTGSLANYNWNDKYSDIDLHILIDYDDIDQDRDMAKKYVDNAINSWKTEHKDITIFGFPVEVYVQDANEKHASSGVYSIDNDKWLVEPDYEKLKSGKVNKEKIRKMVSFYATKIDNLCDIYNETNDDEYRIRKLGEKIERVFTAMKNERKKGLSGSDSEINNGNIMYKALRRGGYLQKIIDLRHKVFDKQHSLLMEEMDDFKVYVMIGIPGAGKSTWIKNNHPDLAVVSRDIIRAELGMCEPGEKYAGTNAEENEVTMHEYIKMGDYCSQRQSFIVDDTNTHKKFRKQMIDFLRQKGAKVVFVHLDTPLDVCKERRKNDIPPEVMDRIHSRFSQPEEDEYDEIIRV